MSQSRSATIAREPSERWVPEYEVVVHPLMRPSPLSTLVELDPEQPDEVLVGGTRPHAWGSDRPRVSPRLRRPRRARASARVRTALVRALGDLATDGRADTSPGSLLWVSDGSPPGAVPPQLGAKPIDLATVDIGQQPPVATLGASSGCVLDGVLEQVDDPGALLAWVYCRLRPGGRLALSVSAASRRRTTGSDAKGTAASDVPRSFPGETLQAHLFRAGFEEPRLRPVGDHVVVSARRSALPPPPERRTRLSVVMPVFNEAPTFDTTIAQVLAKDIPGVDVEVIIVESNSTDGSREKVLRCSAEPRVRVILEDRPRGKGHAVRAGLAAARGDFVLIQDADLEYDVDDYNALLEPLRAGDVGFVLGMRTHPSGSRGMRQFSQRAMTSRVMNVGHEVFLGLFNIVYGQRLRDPFTMYKVVRRDCLYGLTFESNRFDFDWEITGKLVRAGYHPREIPVTYRSRSFHEGKKVTLFRDPITWVRACFKYRFVKLYRDP